MTVRSAVTGILVLGAVLNASCRDGSDGGAASGTTAATTAMTATTTTTVPPPGDQGVALGLTVQQSDFPPGWSQTQPPDDVEDPADKCLKTGPLAASTGRAESAEFAKTDTTTASSVALVFPGVAPARAAFAHVAGAEMRACFDAALRADVEAAQASLVTAPAYPPVPEEFTAYEFTAETAGTDAPYRYSAHLVFVRAGRALLGFAFGNLGDPVPLDEQQSVAMKVAARVGS